MKVISFSNIGLPEILIIMFVLLLFVWPKKFPNAQGIGKGMKEFKQTMKGRPQNEVITFRQ